MRTLNLTDREVELITSALMVVSPSGGGSEPFTLYQQIVGVTNIGSTAELEAYFANTVVEAYRESCE
jgi:hypothetical protein